ncbi:hypothetical protein MMC10_005658 [Thelotrema lepadinum]|nr:hypothetical protein [Thelotrema lepadinum]
MQIPTAALKAVVVAAFASQALGAALIESLAGVPGGWSEASTPASSQQVVLSVALPQQNLDQFYKTVDSVSDPSSTEYGNFLQKSQVDGILRPTVASKTAVTSWLTKNGVSKISSDGFFVNFATDVETANSMLSADFKHYNKEGVSKLRTLSYSVPDDVAKHVDFISPTTFFGKTQAFRPYHSYGSHGKFESRAVDPSCANLITPQCIRELYNTVDYTPDFKASGSKIGFGSFLNQSARYADLAQYETTYNIPSQNFTTVLIRGGVSDQAIDDNHGEANLDVENIVGVAFGLPVTQFITGGSPPFIPNIDTPTDTNEPYIAYYNALLARNNSQLPQVISNSYGDEEDTVPLNYAKRVCNQIAQLGARGITILESSGDLGVGAGCKVSGPSNATRFNPIFPATCPYITAVGGTQSVSPEIAWVASSGGFSDYFAQPAYQAATVEGYLNNQISAETKAYFAPFVNFTGRGFPDVAAHSLTPDYSVVVNGRLSLSGGTSAAAPVWAAVVGLLNDARLRAGQKQLGFLNPLLYSSLYKGLTDITGGQAVGCNGVNGQTGQPVPGAGIVPGAAWNATTGWDPATGLGVPDFQALKTLVLS